MWFDEMNTVALSIKFWLTGRLFCIKVFHFLEIYGIVNIVMVSFCTESVRGDKMQVQIKDIVDCLEMANDDWEQFLNTETGEIVSLSNGFSAEVDEELASEIEKSDHYVRLPNQYDIHEWQIMESFSLEIPLKSFREQLLDSLHGQKVFRRFKDTLDRLGIADDYYGYRTRAFYIIAEDWCKENKIPYKK